MSYVDAGRRPKLSIAKRTIESQLMFGACYLIFLLRALATRFMPWHDQSFFRLVATRESIFREASSAASEIVASSFMGL